MATYFSILSFILLQYFYLGNPMDRGAWWATIHGVAKNRTQESLILGGPECNQRRSPYLAYLSGRMNASYYVWYSEGASYTVRTNWYKIFSLCLPLILENVSSLFLIIFLSFYSSLLGFVGLQFYRYLDSVLKASKLLSSSFPAASAYLPPWWDGLTRSSAHIPQRALLLQIR